MFRDFGIGILDWIPIFLFNRFSLTCKIIFPTVEILKTVIRIKKQWPM